jgi:glycosyltransferase involved in cell wall biosynthesis
MRSMHIIGSRRLGGAESFYLRLVRALDECPGHQALAVTRPGGPLFAALDGGPGRHGVALRNGWDLLSVLALRRLMRKAQPDIIQTYMGRATRLTRLPRNCPAVHVARLGGFYKISGYYRHADAWVGNTKELCDYLVQQGLPAKKVFHIGNFVDLPDPVDNADLAALRTSLRIPEEAVVLFSLGRFIPKKGFGNLLSAFAELGREIHGRPLFLVIAGDGPLKEQLHARTRELGVENRVRWTGWQTDPAPYFQLADVFVCPSIHEPLGNVILEAWAHGKPVLSTATHGAFELIREGENGLLTPVDDARRMSAQLRELLQSGPEVWRQLGKNGQTCLLARHSKEAVVGQYLELYRELQQQKLAGRGADRS